MEIIKYTSKRSVKGKMIDQVFEYIELPCPLETRYVEDVGERELIGKGIFSLPAIYVKNGDKKVILSDNVTPKKLQDAIDSVK